MTRGYGNGNTLLVAYELGLSKRSTVFLLMAGMVDFCFCAKADERECLLKSEGKSGLIVVLVEYRRSQ